jgi:hypothetical protein
MQMEIDTVVYKKQKQHEKLVSSSINIEVLSYLKFKGLWINAELNTY